MSNIIEHTKNIFTISKRALIQASILSTAKTAGESAVSYQPPLFHCARGLIRKPRLQIIKQKKQMLWNSQEGSQQTQK